MKKIVAVLFIAIFSLGLSSCDANVDAIEDHEWKMSVIMNNSLEDAQTDAFVVAVGNPDGSYPEAWIVDMTLTAKDGKITVNDATNGRLYNGTYQLLRETTRGTDYKVIIDGTEGYATAAYTEYGDGSALATLPINIGGYSIYFYPSK